MPGMVTAGVMAGVVMATRVMAGVVMAGVMAGVVMGLGVMATGAMATVGGVRASSSRWYRHFPFFLFPYRFLGLQSPLSRIRT